MAYLDVISLAEAKVYLRVDDTLTVDDAQITSMINSALKYVEDYTQVLVFDRAKTYTLVDQVVRVYDYPINSVTSPTENLETELKTLYTNYCYNDTDTQDLVLNVGYDNPDNVPQDLIQVAYEIIDIFYYGKETGKTMADISPLSMNILNQNKRFLF